MNEDVYIELHRKGRPVVLLQVWNNRSADAEPPKVKGILASVRIVDKVVLGALIQVYGRGVRNFDADGFEHGSLSRGGGLKVDLSSLPTADDEGVSMQNRAKVL
jgi:hypothetical protein